MRSNKKLVITLIIISTVIASRLILQKRKNVKRLFIVGNGFDLYHGIQSSYIRFREYLEQSDEDVYDALNEYLHLDNDDEWNQLENNLANLDGEELLDEMRIFLGDPGNDNWSDSMNHDFQFEVDKCKLPRFSPQLKV